MQFFKTDLLLQQIQNIDIMDFCTKLSASTITSPNINYLFFLNHNGRYLADIFFFPKLSGIAAPYNVLNNFNLLLKQYDLKQIAEIKPLHMHIYYTDQETPYPDPRIPNNYLHITIDEIQNTPSYYYDIKLQHLLAEFDDFTFQKSIILNYGDISRFLSAKGCYPGQELICRMKNTQTNKHIAICEENDPKIIKVLLKYNNQTLAYKYI